MSGWEMLVLLALIAAGWWWFDALKAREAAVSAARAACESEGVMLLDWTVAVTATKLTRNEHGRMQVTRAYAFEYTSTGNNRVSGSIVLSGREVVLVNLAQ
jgi:hypothetical protein